MDKKTETIKEYIEQQDPRARERLLEIWEFIRGLLPPEATEKISWQMPTFALHRNLVHFGAHKSHIGFYPGADGVREFENELTDYKYSKGAIQFPFTRPIPYHLIKRIVEYKLKEDLKNQ